MYLARILLFITILFSLVVSCATRQQQPDWIVQPDINYSSDKYLVASASAESLEVAQDRAITNIAKIFGVQINSQVSVSDNTQVKKTVSSNSENGKLNEQVTQKQYLSSLSNTKVKQLISGVSIKQQWQDNTGVYYALAVLEKRSAAAALSLQLTQLNKQLADLIAEHNASDDLMARLKLLAKAFPLVLSRDKLFKQLKMVSRGKLKLVNTWTLAKLQQLRRRDMANMHVHIISAKPDEKTQIVSRLSSSLASAGFNLKEPHNYVLLVDFTKYKPRYENSWHWQTARLNVQLNSLPARISQSTISWNFKASSSKSVQVAGHRLLEQVYNKINSSLVKHIIEK
mgnify:CR=1 FL=1|jgi:hypothetical protein